MSILDTLITDRTQADVTRWKTLHDKGWSRMSPEEKVEWSSGLKGTYNATDLNRVTAAMEELDQQFRQYGYSTGYQRIEIPHSGNQGVTYLEYIESSGTQYIDTGHKPTNNSRVIMDIEALKGGVYPFFGARTANGVGSFVLWEMSASSIRSDFNTTGTETTVSKVLSHVVIDKNKNVCKFGDTTITSGAASFNCSYNLCLLTLNSGGEVDERKMSAKLYRCQVYDNDTLIHDFRPALDGDGIACLRDEVSKTFYRNSGTGSFVAGPQLEPEPGEEKDPYTWYEDDIPTADLMERYLANVSALRSTIDLLSTTPEAPESMELLTYIEANNIEQILIDIRLTIEQVVRAFKRSNAYAFWSGYNPLPSAGSNLGRNWAELDAMNTEWKNWQVATWYLLLYGNMKAEGVIS